MTCPPYREKLIVLAFLGKVLLGSTEPAATFDNSSLTKYNAPPIVLLTTAAFYCVSPESLMFHLRADVEYVVAAAPVYASPYIHVGFYLSPIKTGHTISVAKEYRQA